MEKTPFENKFFDQLLEETFDHQSTESQFKNEVKGEFLTQTEHFIKKNKSSQIIMSYRPTSGCYRVTLRNKTIDFPKNWSIFSELYQARNNHGDFFCFLREEDDKDYVLEILSNLLQSDVYGVILVKKEVTFMVPVLRCESSSYFIKSAIRE